MKHTWLRCAMLLACLLAITGCTEKPAPPTSHRLAATGLETMTLQARTVDLETVLDGTLEAINRATVAAETTGRVVELPFDVNDYVKKGEVIVRFRDTEQQEQVRSAEANLREAQARLNEAKLAYDRARDIYERQLIAKAQMDAATATFESAKARVTAAQAALNQARERLEHTVVRAPYSGIVEQRHIELGETATVGKPLMTGLSLEHLRAIVDVPQSVIRPLRDHQQARALLPGGESVDATQIRIPPAADPTTHSFRVQVTLPPGDRGLFPGTLVKVAFKHGSDRALLLPGSAVVYRGEVTAAYVVHPDNRIEFRQISVGDRRADGQLPVLAGLVAGEQVALDPIAAGITLKKQADFKEQATRKGQAAP